MRSYLSLLLILLLAGCALENAQPESHQELTLAQNFMSAAQKHIFQKIAKRKHLKLTILELSAGAIRKALQTNPWDPGFDLILIDGLSEQRHFKKMHFAHYDPHFASIPVLIRLFGRSHFLTQSDRGTCQLDPKEFSLVDDETP